MPQIDTETGEVLEENDRFAQQGGDGFALESDPPRGRVPQRVIDELVRARTTAKDYAKALTDAIEAQALKYHVKAGALKRYVSAIEAGKLEECDAETDDLARLLDEGTE